MKLLRCVTLLISLCTVLQVSACGRIGAGSVPAEPRSADSEALRSGPGLQFGKGLPALGQLRGASEIVDNIIAPESRLSASAGFALEGEPFASGRLDAADGGPFEWVVYGFTPPAGPIQELVFSLSDATAIDPAYIAVGNYSSGRWDISGPFSAAAAVLDIAQPLDNSTHLSPGLPPTAYFALIAPVGSDLTLQAVNVRTLENKAPLAVLQADQASGGAPLLVSFDASASSDSDGSLPLFEFDFEDDGIYDVSGALAQTQHTYTIEGSYTARLRVTDDMASSAEATVTIEVSAGNSPPLADLSLVPAEVLTGESFSMDASLSSDSDGSIVKYEWDTDGDGSFETDSGSDSQIEVVSTAPGDFTLQLRVTDDDGASTEDQAQLKVSNWMVMALDSSGDAGPFCSMALVNGNPAICYYAATDGELRYMRATDA